MDIAGTMPSFDALDTLLEDYSNQNELHEPQEFHFDRKRVDKLMKLSMLVDPEPERATKIPMPSPHGDK